MSSTNVEIMLALPSSEMADQPSKVTDWTSQT